ALSSIDGKVVNDRTIAISKISDVSEAKGKCQILFITKTEQDNLKKIIKAVDDLPILAFGDMEHFAEQGGDMNFYILNNRLAIMINPPSVERSKLKISERMLKVVTVVPPVNEPEKPAT
ncbi:MAG: YfiR family protein, partial [Candidatus Berkiella sp.]